MAQVIPPQEQPRTQASARLLAEQREVAERYARASQVPGVSQATQSWLRGASDGIASVISELEWRLRIIETEAALVPEVEPVKERVLGSHIEDSAPSWETLRDAGRSSWHR